MASTSAGPQVRHSVLTLAILGAISCAAARADVRDDFLKMIDRPVVPLEEKTESAQDKNGYQRREFSYQSDADNRVPALSIQKDTTTGKRPVIIALHGTGGTKESMEKILTAFANKGFLAIAIDAPYHGKRSKAGKGEVDYEAAILNTWKTGKGHPFFYDTVWDVRRLIDDLITRDDVNPARIGLFGISKGGIETYLTAAVDPRVAVAVPCIGMQSFDWENSHDSWHSRIGTIQHAFDAAAKEAGIAKPDGAFVHNFYVKVAPGLDTEFDGPTMAALIAPRPLLCVNGDSDPRTPLPSLELCRTAAQKVYFDANASDNFSLLLEPHTAHKVTDEGQAAAINWFVKWLKP